MKTRTAVSMFLLMLLVLFACSSRKHSPSSLSPEHFLREAFPEINATRSSDVRIFRGDSLWEYLDGGADIYYTYGFKVAATADYAIDSQEITVDIFQFDNPSHAYGLYQHFRPPKAQPMALGIEGTLSNAQLMFVKGTYFVSITGFASDLSLDSTLTKLGKTLEPLLPGSTKPPTK